MVELLFPLTLREDMRDCCLDTLFSLGEACVKGEETSSVHVFILSDLHGSVTGIL